jgi:hypothetical protein
MENIYFFAGIIALIYGIFKFIEMRFVDKDARPLKLFVRDTLFVYISVIAANFAFDQLGDSTTLITGGGDTVVFTNNPAF